MARRQARRPDDEASNLTDAELIERCRSHRARYDRKREAFLQAEAEYRARPTSAVRVQIRAAREEIRKEDPEDPRLRGEMSWRVGVMLKAARVAQNLGIRELDRFPSTGTGRNAH